MQRGRLGHAKLQAAHHRSHVGAVPLAVQAGVGGAQGGRGKHLGGAAAGAAVKVAKLLMGGADALQDGARCVCVRAYACVWLCVCVCVCVGGQVSRGVVSGLVGEWPVCGQG